ncbi:hypothetical protein F0562_023660 [Nyssa sinensis]|uniref:BHLH domain-containing protein n=1 Tax=Nyssa sinensis TaxID=561372 RepID=A0A5J5BIQ1_9ASTE|nr:hypothetical protein F0562_023660 [Nyssa sinensis]
MSQCIVSNWNPRQQRQEQVEGEEEKRSYHVHNQKNPSHVVPMSNYEVAELTWQNGQLAMHGLGVGGLLPTAPTKATWGRAGETLESIVHQATCQKHNIEFPVQLQNDQNIPANLSSIVASSGGKWVEGSSGQVQSVQMVAAPAGMVKKRMRSDRKQCKQEERGDRSACASANATFCRENDTTMMTWASFESPRSLKTKTSDEEDSACHGGSENRDEERETKAETGRSQSHSTRRSRAAAVHNQSERRRRDRINQKMKALQKLVPNASKTDKASMLDEVIEYLKQLQAQVQMMSVRNMPWGMMPLGMQQHIQMSLLARMGMGMGLGMGMGMLDMRTMARAVPQSLPPVIHPSPLAATATTPTFVPPHFVVPPMIPAQANPNAATNTSVPFNNPYSAFLAQHSMNMEIYNKMAALYQQQVNQSCPQATSSPSQSNHVRGD